MPTAIETLPLTNTVQPTEQSELVDQIRQCSEAQTPIYPIGGGTSLDFGLPAKRPGIGLSLSGLHRVIDFPARDMTVTVEAGIPMSALADVLRAERQCFPVDVPAADQATIGGVIATNFNGPRRYGLGAIRDFVIGISAVDGRGEKFKGGGRVVKNVAGYDFCKLLTGSLGTLGVITQVTLKLRPIAERSVLMVCYPPHLDAAEVLLGQLSNSAVTPSAIELVSGSAWANDSAMKPQAATLGLIVGIEGSDAEVQWMLNQLASEWQSSGIANPQVIDDAAPAVWNQLIEFPVAAEAPLVLRASVIPSGTTRFIADARKVDPDCSIVAHAGQGLILVRFSRFPSEGLSRTLVATLQATAAALHGNVVVLSNPGGMEMTRQSTWGAIDSPLELMSSVKRQFDPKNILNPDRFLFS